MPVGRGLPKDPTPDEIAFFHQSAGMSHALDKYRVEADRTLSAYTEKVVEGHQKQILTSAFEAGQEAAETSPWRFVRGVAEAVVGAFFWTILLVILTILAQRAGIDVIEDYKRLSGK